MHLENNFDKEIFKINGPYFNRLNNRMYVVLYYENGKKNTITYARYLVQLKLGRVLHENEIVHHKNGDVSDDRLSELEIISRNEHSVHHNKLRGLKFVRLKCPECGNIFIKRRNLTILGRGGIYNACSRVCNAKFSHKLKNRDKDFLINEAIMDNIIEELVVYEVPS